ncbi:hypothetical protein UP12_19580 (plasmid) [Bacillus pumilus]|nr:hypothetical protein UP12_19580 [Bacillus pumilus]
MCGKIIGSEDLPYINGYKDEGIGTQKKELEKLMDIRFKHKKFHTEESTIVRRVSKLEDRLK